MSARRIAYVVIGLVIAASGGYLFVYLYRWEWNRALIAGVIFIGAEIALAAGLILDKMRALEDRLDARIDERAAAQPALQALKETAPPARAHFKWLGGDELSVFVPVLMGAGIVFSGLAWVVEKFARATAKPVLEQSLALRLAPLALPEGGFLAPVEAELPRIRTRDRLRHYRGLFAMLLLIAIVSVSIDKLGDLTQNRPQLDVEGDTGAVVLDISKNGWARSEVAAVRSLWGACAGTVAPHMRGHDFRMLASGNVSLSITPAPGISAQKRLLGCFEDATIDNVQARVVDTRF